MWCASSLRILTALTKKWYAYAMTKTEISATRLRIGVLLLVLWFLPFWLLGPEIASAFGISSPRGIAAVTGTITIIQTAIGITGAVIAGKQAAQLMKHGSLRKRLRRVIHVLWTGEIKPDSP